MARCDLQELLYGLLALNLTKKMERIWAIDITEDLVTNPGACPVSELPIM